MKLFKKCLWHRWTPWRETGLKERQPGYLWLKQWERYCRDCKQVQTKMDPLWKAAP